MAGVGATVTNAVVIAIAATPAESVFISFMLIIPKLELNTRNPVVRCELRDWL